MNIFQMRNSLFPFLYKKHNIIISDKEKTEILNNVDNHNDNIQQEYNKEKETINKILQKLDYNISKEDRELNEKNKYYLNIIKNELENKKLDFVDKKHIESIINKTNNHFMIKGKSPLYTLLYLYSPFLLIVFIDFCFGFKNIINCSLLDIFLLLPSVFFVLCELYDPTITTEDIDKLNHWTNYNKNNLLSHSKDEKTDFNKSNLNTLESDILFHMV